jgi:hypothetical protein
MCERPDGKWAIDEQRPKEAMFTCEVEPPQITAAPEGGSSVSFAILQGVFSVPW